jgi:hypothetical protein
MTTREKALERALLRLCEECPAEHVWPAYKAAVSDALHLLTQRITPAEYLAATEEPDVNPFVAPTGAVMTDTRAVGEAEWAEQEE